MHCNGSKGKLREGTGVKLGKSGIFQYLHHNSKQREEWEKRPQKGAATEIMFNEKAAFSTQSIKEVMNG